METLKRFDDFLFDAPLGFQNLANLIEYLTTLRYYTQVRVCLVVYLAFYLNLNLTRLQAVEDLSWVVGLVFGTVMLFQLILLGFIWILSVFAKMNTDRGRRNPLRDLPNTMFVRLMFVFFFAYDVATLPLTGSMDAYDVLYNVFTVTVIYLVACEEAPPLQQTSAT